ncbi:Cation-transporting ATPase [Nitrobacter sp. Nb-311A]|uniref:cation-translocating P-type ATPase n=1 Tax=unclassified Nitrobacter TaxID=2620411 RepID=UPI00006865ED|nr:MULTISPECIES: cation-translocating P-type ATPase [unclassified Nitrobacter]EAQ36009.1 Cation-transporting ATPase [Nitrobacter sp. Nb-311A]MCB1393350.1 cation-translocating P-type ATPase [Nitrobacter sp.]
MQQQWQQPRDPHRLPADEVVKALGTTVQFGLSDDEVKRRLARYGRNELQAEPPRPAWLKFLDQFANILVVLLIIAAVISAGLWFYESRSALPYEAIAIFIIVLLNAVLGYVQESRAQKAMAALRQMAATRANVIREGAPQRISAAELVPGDIIFIEEGSTIPADARLVQSTALQLQEAALTGESLPVSKDTRPIATEAELGDRHNMVFSGTTVAYGHGRAVITATGIQTQIGRIAGLLERAPEETTPLQKELDRVGKLLAVIVVVIASAMIGIILLLSEIRGLSDVFDALIFGVALAVAAVPEGLPAIVTAVLALGVQRMAGRNAIIRKLAAVEALGSANVIASDKTGTLTKNEMTVRRIVTASGCTNLSGTGYVPDGDLEFQSSNDTALQHELSRALRAADRANNAVLREDDGRWTILGDPTEGALIVAARKAGLTAEALDKRFPRVAEVPFSSERKLMSTIHADAKKRERLIALTKGAPDVLLTRCSHELVGREARRLTDARRAEILMSNEALAADALRTLGVAFRSLSPDLEGREGFDESIEQDLVFLGLIGMMDPPREEARIAIAKAKRAGIRPIMITGDHPKTAAVIAAELGIASGGHIVAGLELKTMSDAALDRAVAETSIYARVSPEHKLRIVEALQRSGMMVAMTGDGVNDAPALKRADIGIAMGITGTDVSKEAADMVLADDNFATIVAAVEEGRAIFANIRRFLRYLLSSNIGEVMTMFFGVLLASVIGLSAPGGDEDTLILPLMATQILWINLVTDGGPALALGVDPVDARTMTRPPRPRGEGVITRRMWRGIFFVGAVMAAGTLLVLDASLPGGLIEGKGSVAYAQTMAFTTLTMFQLFNVFNARSDEQSAFVGLFRNNWLSAAVVFSLILHIAVVYVPFLQEAFSTTALGPGDWLICTVVASSVLWSRELGKLAVRAGSSRRRDWISTRT